MKITMDNSTANAASNTMSMDESVNASLANFNQAIWDASDPMLVVTKEWHRTFSPDFRRYMIYDFLRRVFPMLFHPFFSTTRITSTIIGVVKRIEGEAFQVCDSKMHYHALMAIETVLNKREVGTIHQHMARMWNERSNVNNVTNNS